MKIDLWALLGVSLVLVPGLILWVLLFWRVFVGPCPC